METTTMAERQKSILLRFLCSFLLLFAAHTQAQTLITDSVVPVLDVCDDYRQFSVKIANGSQPCSGGSLTIQVPVGFEIDPASVRIDNVAATPVTVSEREIRLDNLNIPASPPVAETEITYNVRAVCGIIGNSANATASYSLNCGGTPVPGTSEIINIRYAVLRISTAPSIISGQVNDQIERTLTVVNQGNGSVAQFTIDRTLGNGLSHVSYDYSGLPAGWTVDNSNPNQLVFTATPGTKLDSGGTLSIKETVEIDACAVTPTNYEVYFGCNAKCTAGGVNGFATQVIVIDTPGAPRLSVSAATPVVGCFNDFAENTWTLTNNSGTATTGGIIFEIKIDDAGGYINDAAGTILVGGVPYAGTVTFVPTTNPTSAFITLPDLPANGSVTIGFEQYYPAPDDTPANCAGAPTQFGIGSNSYGVEYNFAGSCASVSSGGTVSSETFYRYSGIHFGEVDIENPSGTLEYLFTGFNIPSTGLNIGDQFTVTIDLGPNLTANAADISLGGVTATGGSTSFEITFTYGTAPWTAGTSLDYAFSRLEFPVNINCPVGFSGMYDLHYTVGGELRKAGACSPVVFQCNTTNLRGFCDSPGCLNGFRNEQSRVERITLGDFANAAGVPTIGSAPVNHNPRVYITDDIIEIYQWSEAQIETGNTFNTVRFVVEIDPAETGTLVPNSGSVTINGNPAITGLSVTPTSTGYVLEHPLGANLAHGDRVRLSLQIQAGSAVAGALRRFPTASYLVDTATNEGLLCGRTYTATGFYAPTSFETEGGNTDFVDCSESTNSFIFTASVLGLNRQDAVFPNEYRGVFQPTNAVLSIPADLTLTSVTVTVEGQPWLAGSSTTVLTGLPVTNGNYTLNVANAIAAITGGPTYLDEGFRLIITPTVELASCLTSVTANQTVGITFNGNILGGNGSTQAYTASENLIYDTGIGSLTIDTANNNTAGAGIGTFNSNGASVYWIVKIENESTSRNFNSVWFNQTAGVLNIISVERVDNYMGANPLPITAVAGIYQLNDFAPGATRYYRIEAAGLGCTDIRSLALQTGYGCNSSDYAPANLTCNIENKELTHLTIGNNLQTNIWGQFNGQPANVKPDLCGNISYIVELHNGGDRQLGDLTFSVPLNDTLGLEFVGVEFSNVYPAGSAPGVGAATWTGISAAAGTVGPVTNVLTVEFPAATVLPLIHRISARVTFRVTSCEFRSGTRHQVTPAANSICSDSGTRNPVVSGDINEAGTRRLLINGGSDAFPELGQTVGSSVVLNPVLSTGGWLQATYNAEIRNTGAGGNTDAITTEYQVSLRLPANWTIVGSPVAALLPANKVSYVGFSTETDPLNPTLVYYTYIYDVIDPVTVGQTLRFADLPLQYQLDDSADLDCEVNEVNLGDIILRVFQNIDITTVCSIPPSPDMDCTSQGIDQELFQNILPLNLPAISFLEINPPVQDLEVCNPSVNGGTPTLADIELANTTNVFHLDWYANLPDAQADAPNRRLPLTTPLTDGFTYYVINRFIVNGDCKSNVGEITVTFKDNNLSASVATVCDIDNENYRLVVTLTGTAPFAVDPSSTGASGSFAGNVWTSEWIPASSPFVTGTAYDVTFTDANNCTPLNITGNAAMCCELEIDCPAAITIDCDEDRSPARTGAPAIVQSCGNTSYTYSDTAISACAAGTRSFTRTFTVTDQQGNIETCTQVITIIDNVDPVFNEALPQDITVSCASLIPAAPSLTATDNCGNAEVTFNETRVNGTCDNDFTLTRTWTATDTCGNRTVHTQTIIVNDDVVPTFVGALPAAAVTVSCAADIPAAATLTATDNCGTATVTLAEITTPGTCANNFTVTRTWTAADGCGNTATYAQVITVNDDVDPVILTPAQDRTVACEASAAELTSWLANNAGATATDNCGAVTWTNDYDAANFVATCGNAGSVTVVFTATDACGNASTTTAAFTVTDTVAPVFTSALPTDVTVSCAAEVPASVEATLTATDNCSSAANITITATDVISNVSPACANNYTITRTYTATDECGNAATHTQIITVKDEIAPTFNGVLPANVTVSCSVDVPAAPIVTAADNCGTTPITAVLVETRVNGSCANSYVLTRTWTATDDCGNATTHTQIITVKDEIAPVFDGVLPANVTVTCTSEVPTAPVVTATDNCGTATVTFNETRVEGSCASSYVLTRIWTATDDCGNVSTHTQTITVADTVAPTFTTNPQHGLTECGTATAMDDYNAWLNSYGGSVATDNCGTVTMSRWLEDTNTICGFAGTVTWNFAATDECGNRTIRQATFMFRDTTPPVIDDTNKVDLVIECSINAEDELNAWLSANGGLTATDSCSPDVTWSHDYQGQLAVCGAPITVTFTATDACGNTATETATVQVVDTVLPILTKQAQSLTVQCGTNTTQALNNWLANQAGAEAIDSCSTVTWTNNYDAANFVAACGATGSVEVIFTGSDSCGNVVTTTATFTIEDTTAPVLVTPAQNQTVECDGSGNTAALQTWLTNNAGATATDTCDANLTWTNNYNPANFAALCGATGSISVTFTATDACGNSVSTVGTFTIVDTTNPIFTTDPQNEVVECDGAGNTAAYNAWLTAYGNSVAADVCGGVTYTYSVIDTAILCGSTSRTTVQFTATDACGNTVSKQATFTIEDTTAPLITTEAIALTIECGNDASNQINTWLNNNGGAIATDVCGSVTWSHNYNGLTTTACGNTGSALVTFTATDACGNVRTTQATVSIVDTTLPVLTKQAQSLTVQCGTNTTQALNNWLANHAGAEATDSCSIVTWTNNYDPANFVAACGNTGSVEVIFTGSDACGNVVRTTATFTIEDTTAPVLVTPAQPQTVECGPNSEAQLLAWLANNGGATATDTCDADLTWTNDYDNGANFIAACGNTGEVTVTFTATDDCNNSISTVAKFTIVDTTAPVFDIEPQSQTVECDGTGNTAAYDAWLASFAGADASDNCGNVTLSYTLVDTEVLCGNTSRRVVRFTATDECGNRVSKQASFTIEDTEAPVITAPVETVTIVECDGNGNLSDLAGWLQNRAGATAEDVCSSVTWTHDFTGLSDECGATGSATVTFTATDDCGNSDSYTATFTIVDTTAPVFVGNLPQDRTIECSDPMPEVETLNADDLCSKATVSFTQERIDGDCPNNYEIVRTWTAADDCGNTTEHVQVITVQDTTPPEFISELPEEEIFIRCEDLKEPETLKASDNCGPAVVTVFDEELPSECGSVKYTILRTWTATDECGNTTSFTQTIHVSCQIEVFNAVTPNGDGYNDELVLEGIECYPGNKVEIFNRWGVLVYETDNYNSNGNTFKGYSNGRVTVSKSEILPTGTYWYVIKYNYDLGNGEVYPIEQAGYLHLETNK